MFHFKSRFDYPPGKPMSPRILRCQWFRVGYYTFAIGRLDAWATSTFAKLGYKNNWYAHWTIFSIVYNISDECCHIEVI